MFNRLRRRLLALAYWGYGLARWQIVRPVTVGVRILLIQDGAAMLIRHSYQDDWNLPGGGVKQDETLAAAAAREAREEVGAILLEAPWLLGIYANFARRRSDHVAVFVCEAWTWVEPSDRWEIEGRALFALDAMPPDLPAGLRRVLADHDSSRGRERNSPAVLGSLTERDA